MGTFDLEQLLDKENIILLTLLDRVKFTLSGGPEVGLMKRLTEDQKLDLRNKLLAMVQCIDRHEAIRIAQTIALQKGNR